MTIVVPTTATESELRVRVARLRVEPTTRSAKGGALRIKGVAVVYGVPSDGLPFVEIFEKGAFRDALKGADLLLLAGHDRNRPLARQSAGNLTVRDTSRGLEFEASLVDTSDGRDWHELVRAGVVKGCSFAFYSDPQGERWAFENGQETCVVSRVKRLVELTLTAEPAYSATSVEPRAAALEAIRRNAIRVRERSVYGPDSSQSWFHDLAQASEAAAVREARVRAGLDREGASLELFSKGAPANRDRGGPEEAMRRLATVPHRRDVATSAVSGLAEIPGGVPEFIAATLGEAARARTIVTDALPAIELPAGFVVPASVVQTEQVTTPTTGAVQTAENAAVTVSDPDGTEVALKPGTITGRVRFSRQLVERGSGIDELIARELGGALGAVLENQVINGSGAAGQLTGLRTIASIIALSYTDATPSAAELWVPVLQARSQIASQISEPPSLLAAHPRRASWLMAALDTANAAARLDPPMRVLETIAAPTNLGGGSNEDALVMIAPNAVTLATRPPAILIDNESSAPQSIGFLVWQFAALVARQPKGIATITGTGLVAPAGY